MYQIHPQLYHITDMHLPYADVSYDQVHATTKKYDAWGIQFDDFETIIHYAYNQFYLEMVYEILQIGQWTPMWFNPSKATNVRCPGVDEIHNDQDVTLEELGADVAKRGTFFPLYGSYDPFGKVYSMRQGKHRWLGLQLNNVDKEYLYIPYENFTFPEQLPVPIKIPVLDIENKTLVFVYESDPKVIAKKWYSYSENMAYALRYYDKDHVTTPYRIWDNKDEFERFLAAKDEFSWLNILKEDSTQ